MNQRDARLTFDWQKSRWDYRLPVLIAISFLAHVFCFYLFRVVYPATTALLPPSAQVTVLDSNRPADKEVLDWVTMNDPANLSAPKFDSEVISRVAPRYEPIYSTLSVPLRSSDAAKPKEKGVPSIFSTGTLLPVRAPLPVGGPHRSFPTRIEFASTLQAEAPAGSLKLPQSVGLAEPTSVFVGVSPHGDVDYLFLLQSSGSNALDQKAEDFIQSIKFKTAPDRTWGTVKLRWGGAEP